MESRLVIVIRVEINSLALAQPTSMTGNNAVCLLWTS